MFFFPLYLLVNNLTVCICACEAVLSFCCLRFFYLLILNQISSSSHKFGEISHNVPIPLYVVQKHKCRKQGNGKTS